MPSVNIREIDNTGAEQVEYIENIVLTPAIKIENKNLKVTLDGLYTSGEAFKAKLAEVFSDLADKNDDTQDIIDEKARVTALKDAYYKDLGYVMAISILNKGLPIQYYGAYNFDKGDNNEYAEGYWILDKNNKTFHTGLDGLSTNPKSEFYNQVETESIPAYEDTEKHITVPAKNIRRLKGLYKFIDRGRYDIRFITPGKLVTDTKFLQDCMLVAANRGDAYALLSHPETYLFKGQTEETTISSSLYVEKWLSESGLAAVAQYNQADLPLSNYGRNGYTWRNTDDNMVEKVGSYAALFTPTIVVELSFNDGITSIDKTIDKYYVPAYIQYLFAYKTSTKNNPTWFAIAGATRGTSSSAIIPLIEYGDEDIDLFQPRSGEDNKQHVASNAIYYLRGTGYTIWGNRTMHPLNTPSNGSSPVVQLVASDFLNIRSLATDLKKAIYRSCRAHTFDSTDDNLWFAFKSEITPILENMKANQGIRGYQIIRITTNKRAVLAARIKANPIEGVEDFDVTIEFSDQIQSE